MATTSLLNLAFFGTGLFEFLLLIPFFFIGLLGTVFWLWMLIDCLTHEPSAGNDKLIWVLVILFTHFIGALIYFFVQRPKRHQGRSF